MITESQLQNRVTIGKRIAEIRQSKKLTQVQLAELSGLNRVNINKIENGRYNVSIDILQKVCDALDIELILKNKDMKIEEIKTLEELKEYINSHEDWMVEVNDVIENNGWIDETGISVGICNDGKKRLIFDSEMKAVIIDMIEAAE